MTTDRLRVGDHLRQVDPAVPLLVTDVRTDPVSAPVFNLAVADLHTYYVLAGALPVLVHNQDPCPPSKEQSVGPFDTFEQARNKALQLLGPIDPATRRPQFGSLEKAAANLARRVALSPAGVNDQLAQLL